MASVGVVQFQSRYYREYEVEPNDSVAKICLKFGFSDWNRVWLDDANIDFRGEFNNDAANIAPGRNVRFRIPLVGGEGAESVRLKRLRDYLFVRILNIDFVAFPGIKVRIVEPGAKHRDQEIVGDANGYVFVSNLIAGDHSLVSSDFLFVPASQASMGIPAQDLNIFSLQNNKIHPTNDVTIPRNTIIELVARRVYYIICPMCAVFFRTIQN